VKVSILTFQFNALLLHKRIHFFPSKMIDPKLLNTRRLLSILRI